MLTREENELITRVGPGTPMGEVWRRYWIIAGLSREVPTPDSPPVRIRLLGEDLVMFRDTNGNVGLLEEKCAHRRASLFFGRNEECGLRCIYHGWKYDVDGNIVDTPAEPAESMIKHHVKHPAYPTFEKNGVILTYMGPKTKQPLVPNYEWLTLPEDQVRVEDKYWNENNWLQSIEGDCDSSHLNFLHRNANEQGTFDLPPGMAEALDFKVRTDGWLVRAAAIRHLAPGQNYVRMNFFALPAIGGPPQTALDGFSDGHQAVHQTPADDYNTWRVDIYTRRSGPHNRGYNREQYGWPGVPDGSRPVDEGFRKLANRSNGYLMDREKQRSQVYAGIPFGAHTQDAAMTESMGAIADREHEHLGMCDAQPIAIRQLLLKVVRDVAEGKDPPGVAFREEDNNFNYIQLTHATLPDGVDPFDFDAVPEHMLYSGAPPRSGRMI
jgi:phenylpropionate dioxygenase-like ring-hydroxylating dioxygenase large terminal subunit